MEILSAEGLVKTYSRRRVVDGVSLSVSTGEIVGLLGPNGAGKSTSFKMMCGLVRPDRGTVRLQDVDVTSWPLHRRSREGGMGYLPQQSSVFSKLSVQDNLKGMMQLLGFSRKRQKLRTEELLEQFKITHIRKSKAGKLSGGEKRRLEIARCLVAEPKIVMLDEPFAGIDPVTVQGVQGVIRELAATGISVLITDHAAREILQITDRTYVVSEGRILCSGTADQVVAHPEVRKKYLGDITMPAAPAESSARGSVPTSGFQNQPDALPPQATDAPASVDPSQRLKFPSRVDSPANAATSPVQSRNSLGDSLAEGTSETAGSEHAFDGRPAASAITPGRPRMRKVVAPFKSTDLDS